jgi:hypothetical protein
MPRDIDFEFRKAKIQGAPTMIARSKVATGPVISNASQKECDRPHTVIEIIIAGESFTVLLRCF